MPYYVHRKTVTVPESIGSYGWDWRVLANASNPYIADEDRLQAGDVLGDYVTREDAYRAMSDASTTDYTVTFRATTDEQRRYEYREQDRFRRGDYLPCPWYGTEGNDGITLYRHFAHLSVQTPGMVAYTPDDEYGYADRQIRIKPGKYLTRFYGNVLTAEQIADYVARCNVTATYSVTRDADEIERVYTSGPGSCMSHGVGDYCTDEHPSRAYADSPDLALAYFGDPDGPSQRAIIWPAEKTYTRIYGTGPLRLLLEKDGYTQAAPYNARLVITWHRRSERSILCPYIDHITRASVDGRYLVLDDEGPYGVQSADGYASVCYDEDENTCDHCGSAYDPNDEGTDEYCQSCEDGRQQCDDCGDLYFTTRPNAEDFTNIDGIGDCCESCTDDHTKTCEDATCSHTWIEENTFTDEQTEDRTRRNVADLCIDCADRYVYCDHCEESYDPSDSEDGIAGPVCPTCDRAPRCTDTGDLLAVLDTLETSETDPPSNAVQTYTLPNACTEEESNVAF